jgi:hypothetical protein
VRNNLNDLPPTAQRLFPAVYSNLPTERDDPVLARLKRHHRDAWLKNELLLRKAGEVIEALQGTDIPVLVLKGAALCLTYYDDVGARPMGDVDLLVGEQHLHEAAAVLGEMKWAGANARFPDGPLQYDFHVEHPDGAVIDLHAYALAQSVNDEDFWGGSISLMLEGLQTRTLCPADQLLHVCVHGLRCLSGGSPIWIVDALKVIRSQHHVDWDRLVQRSRARLLTLPVEEALVTLRDVYAADIPSDVISGLSRSKRRIFETIGHWASKRPPGTAAFALASWDRYRRFAILGDPEARPGGFIEFLARGWGLKGGRLGVLIHASTKILRRKRRGEPA